MFLCPNDLFIFIHLVVLHQHPTPTPILGCLCQCGQSGVVPQELLESDLIWVAVLPIERNTGLRKSLERLFLVAVWSVDVSKKFFIAHRFENI
jgi:hypothetical protein